MQQLVSPPHDFSWHYSKNVPLKRISCIMKVISLYKHYLYHRAYFSNHQSEVTHTLTEVMEHFRGAKTWHKLSRLVFLKPAFYYQSLWLILLSESLHISEMQKKTTKNKCRPYACITNTMPLLPSEGQEIMSLGQRLNNRVTRYKFILNRKGASLTCYIAEKWGYSQIIQSGK